MTSPHLRRWRQGHRAAAAVCAGLACLSVMCRQFSFAAIASPNPIATLRSAVRNEGSERPTQADVLQALVQAKTPPGERDIVFRKVVDSGKKWRLFYVASKDQVAAARTGKDTLPGIYLSSLNYVQSFEGQGDVRIKQEGISGSVLGIPWFIGDIARIKWPDPEKRSTMVIESMMNVFKALGQEIKFPADGVMGPGPDGDAKFNLAPVGKGSGGDFTTVNFMYADDDVAVAVAETGAIALYGATDV
eukprot:TRINITY_DN104219_c0_g1_i1.p1 TRINITY_DN104219_c0_g1~~TRINITY_DN104219_c0_g1_i1.p1  ORF type:complete len:265 (-),score=35.93 TRINITY_DN104219_c0_g1_i1:349-1086(-)